MKFQPSPDNRPANFSDNVHGFSLQSVCWGYRDIFTKILERPIFKEELHRIGFSPKNINDYMFQPDCMVKESSNENLKEYQSGITRIVIPPSDVAFEISRESDELLKQANCLLIKILKGSVDVSGLTPRTKKTTITDYFR